MPLDDMHSTEGQEQQALSMDIASLKAAAQARSGKRPNEKEITVKQIARDPYIAEYAKTRANGICQLCGKAAPFLDSNGKPYLESHHVVWLSQGGEDSIENTVDLCPNCHRKMHIVADPRDVEKLKQKAKA